MVIGAEETKEAGALGYMERALVQATMPHKNPGTVEGVVCGRGQELGFDIFRS